MSNAIIKTGTWRHGFAWTSEQTDVRITIEPWVRGNGNIRGYRGWIYSVPGIGASTPANPLGLGRIILGTYHPQYKQMLMDRIENELVERYMVQA